MNESSGNEFSLIVISANVSVIRANEDTFVINVPEGLSSNLMGFGIVSIDECSVLKFRFEIIWVHFTVIGGCVEQLFEVKDFNDGGDTDFEFVADDKKFGGTVVEFDVFELERESDVSQ